MIMINKMKNKTIPYCLNNSKTNIKITERGKIDTNNTLIHDILCLVFAVEINLEIFEILRLFLYYLLGCSYQEHYIV